MNDGGFGEIAFYFLRGLLLLTVIGGIAIAFAAMRRSARKKEDEARRGEWGDTMRVDGDQVRYSRAELSGMSLPDRLAAFGVTEDWSRATAARDRSAMILTLRRILLSPEEAARTADATLLALKAGQA